MQLSNWLKSITGKRSIASAGSRCCRKRRRSATSKRGQAIEHLEQRTLLATVSWAVDADGDWSNAANWLDDQGVNRLPTSADDVVIDRPGADVTVTNAGTRNVQSLTLNESLEHSSGTLRVNEPSTLNGSYVQTGGIFDADGQTVINGNANLSGGTWSGSTGFLVAAAGTVNVSGPANKTINTVTFQNSGHVNLTGSGLLVGGSGTTFENQAGGVWEFRTDASMHVGRMRNSGIVRKSGGVGESRFGTSTNSMLFHHEGGTVDVQTGTLTLNRGNIGGFSTGGHFQVAAGAVLDLTGGAANLFEGTYTGEGDGTVSLNGGSVLATGVGFTFEFPVGLLEWTGGTLGSNAAASPFVNTGFLTIDGGDTKFLATNTSGLNFNDGTIVQKGTGVVDGGILTNRSGGMWDIQSDADVALAQFLNEGLVRKSGGAGETQLAVTNNDRFFHRGGTIEVQTGSVQIGRGDVGFSTGGHFVVAAGTVLDLVAAGSIADYEGMYTGAGSGTVRLSQGTIRTDGSGATFDFPAGLFEWTGGQITSSLSAPFSNNGFLQLVGDVNKTAGGTDFRNAGTVIQSGAGALHLATGGAGSFVDNLAGAVWEFSGTGGITGASSFDNFGSVRKTTDAGEIPLEDYNSQPGSRTEVLTGKMTLAGNGNSTGGHFHVDAGAVLDFSGGTNDNRFSGTYTGTGGGRVELNSGRIIIDDGGIEFVMPVGLLHWTGGEIQGNSVRAVTNRGFLHLTGDDDKLLSGQVPIHNRGTIVQTDAGALAAGLTSVVLNESGAVWDLQGAADFRRLKFTNAGTLRKTGAGDSVAERTNAEFSITGGRIEVLAGRLVITPDGDSTGGHFHAEGSGVLEFDTLGQFTLGGTYTGSGDGRVELTGSLSGDADNPPHFDLPEGLFHWVTTRVTERINGPFTNHGFMTLNGPGNVIGPGGFVNSGTLLYQSGLLEVARAGVLTNAGTIDIEGDLELNLTDLLGVGSALVNTGTIRKSAGPGRAQIGADPARSTLSNTGTIEVLSGELELEPEISELSGGVLSDGTWTARDATLNLGTGREFSTLEGTVTLSGDTSQVTGLSDLDRISGHLNLLNGRDLTTTGDLTLEAPSGGLTVGVGSTLTVTGDFVDNSNTAEFILGGRPSTGDFGRIGVSGRSTLSNIAVSLAPGFGPTNGDVWEVMTFKGRDGADPTFTGLEPFFEANVSATSVTLNAVASGFDLFVDDAEIAAPATGAPGDPITVTYTVRNADDRNVPGDWTDSVYLSRDETWSADDLLLGRVPHTGGLTAGGSYSETLDSEFPGVPDGRYHVLVIADSGRHIVDRDRENNQGASVDQIQIDVPLLPLNTLVQGTIADGADLFYRIDVPAGAGDAIIEATFAALNQAELLVSYRSMPTRTVFEYETGYAKMDRELILTSPQAGAYYVRLHGREGAAAGEAFEIQVNLVDFEVRSLSPDAGSRAGAISMRIEGAGFSPGGEAHLLTETGVVAASATSVDFLNRNTLVARFDLQSVLADTYDVQVVDRAGTLVLEDGFEVTNANAGHLDFSLNTEQYIRAGQRGDLILSYRNTGGTDIPIPFFIVYSDISCFERPKITKAQAGKGRSRTARAGAPIQREIPCPGHVLNEVREEDTYHTLMAPLSNIGAPETLAPGEGGEIIVPFLPMITGPHVRTELRAGVAGIGTIDYDTLEAAYQPSHLDADTWNTVWNNFAEGIGNNNHLSFLEALRENAVYLAQAGLPTTDIGRLLSFELNQASDFGEIVRRQTLGGFGRGHLDPFAVSLLREDNGDIRVRMGSYTRRFTSSDNGQTYLGANPKDQGRLTLLPSGTIRLQELNGLTFDFDSNDNLSAIEEPNGIRLTYNYMNGQVSSVVNSAGESLNVERNQQGRIVRLSEPTGRVTDYRYDVSGEYLQEIESPFGTTSISYITGSGGPAEHAVRSITFADGSQHFYEYDAFGRLSRQSRNGDAEVYRYEYSGPGRIDVTDPFGFTTSLYRDELGRIIRTVDPLGNQARVLFDDGNLARGIESPAGVQFSVVRDALQNVSTIIDAIGGETQIPHAGPFNRIADLVDQNGNRTEFTYDARGNLITITDEAGNSRGAQYDENGRVTKSTNARGVTTTYEYDSTGNLIRWQTGSTVAEEYTYDGRGNLTSVLNQSGITSLDYDARDLLTKVTYPNGRFLEYEYDSAGRRTRISSGDGVAERYTYDVLGRMVQVTDDSGTAIIRYSYDLAGRLEHTERSNGVVTTNSYNSLGQLVSIVSTASATQAVVSQFEYEYDEAGYRTLMRTIDGETRYEYDAAGQLREVHLPSGESIAYQYDSAGNRLTVSRDSTLVNYVTNELNQYTRIDSTVHSYDQDGNLVSSADSAGLTSYQYDADSRLTAVSSPDEIVEYEYDAFGFLSAAIRDGERVDYLIDPTGQGRVVGEYFSNGNLKASYTHGLGLVSRQTAETGRHYYGFDALGSTSELTDSSGAVIDRYSYLPFGSQQGTPPSTDNPFTFVGQYGVMQFSNDFYYMRNRFYSSSAGRFSESDPLGFVAGDANLYRYVQNSPTSFIDPTGLLVEFLANPPGTIPAPPTGPPPTGLPLPTPTGPAPPFVPVAPPPAHPPGVPAWPTPHSVLGVQVSGTLAAEVSTLSAGAVAGYALLAAAGGALVGTGVDRIAGATAPEGQMVIANWIAAQTGIDQSNAEFGPAYDRHMNNPCVSGKRSGGADVADAVGACSNQTQETGAEEIGAWDPNDIIGPGGFGPEKFLVGEQVFPYSIRFENLAEATAPAQKVVITQQLDSDFDLSTFEFGNFGFSSQEFSVPSGRSYFDTRLDFVEDLGLFLDVEGSLNVLTGEVTWTFISIDPETGDLLNDVFGGFLPPNADGLEGQGFVSYRVRPKTGLPSGTRIDAEATIVFDANPAIGTPLIFNTSDDHAPFSSVDSLPAVVDTVNIPVSWAGDDGSGSGIASWDIYVSVDDGPFEVWLQDSSETSADYPGENGRTYAFYSVATDNVGHVEPPPPSPDTQTTVDAGPVLIGPLGPITETLPTISWNSVPDAVSYEVWLELLGGSNNPLINPTVTETHFTLTNALDIGRYRSWVRANLAAGGQTDWTTGDFQVSIATTVHSLPFHGDNPRPEISWDLVPGATSYRVYIDNNTAGNMLVADETVNGTSFTPSADFAFGRHQIWVRAIGADGFQAAWSEVQRYNIGPDLLTPMVSTFNDRPEFTWTSLPDIASVQLYVSRGSTVAINQTGITGTSFEPSTPLNAGDYRWWIRPFHTSGRGGAWSELGTFSVGGFPILEGPSGRITDSTPQVVWGSVEGAGSYEVYLFNDDGAGLVHRQAGIPGTTFDSFPLQDGNYRVWVKSYELSGDPGRWSRSMSFTIDSASISTTATPASPLAPTFETQPTFSWTAQAGSDSVDLYLTNGTTVISESGLPGNNWTPPTALDAGIWHWWVRASDATGNKGPWSDRATTDISGRPVLLSPSGSTGNMRPKISWTPVDRAVRYIFQLDNLSTEQSAIIREDDVAAAEFTPGSDLAAGDYRAWVRAIDGDTNQPGPWSLRLDFTVVAAELPSTGEYAPAAELLSVLLLPEPVSSSDVTDNNSADQNVLVKSDCGESDAQKPGSPSKKRATPALDAGRLQSEKVANAYTQRTLDLVLAEFADPSSWTALVEPDAARKADELTATR